MMWIVGVTNAFNLLDNMDGLCGGTAVIGTIGLLLVTLQLDGVTPQALNRAAARRRVRVPRLQRPPRVRFSWETAGAYSSG